MMVHYSFLVQAWVWGEPEPPAHLPANLARPIVALADRLGQAPLLPYSAYVLDNWARIDKAGPDRARQHPHGAELPRRRGRELVRHGPRGDRGRSRRAARQRRSAGRRRPRARAMPRLARTLLAEMDLAWERIYAVFKRMPERCDPYVYFHRVRPYIHGWANNPALAGDGLVYEGVDKFAGKPQAFRGQTGSQSSIVPAMDALFGVRHSDDPLKHFLDELHQYRPVPHRRFIEDLAAALHAARVRRAEPTRASVCSDGVQRLRRAGRPLPHAAPRIRGELHQQAGRLDRGQRSRRRHGGHAVHEVPEEAPRREPGAGDSRRPVRAGSAADLRYSLAVAVRSRQHTPVLS